MSLEKSVIRYNFLLNCKLSYVILILPSLDNLRCFYPVL